MPSGPFFVGHSGRPTPNRSIAQFIMLQQNLGIFEQSRISEAFADIGITLRHERYCHSRRAVVCRSIKPWLKIYSMGRNLIGIQGGWRIYYILLVLFRSPYSAKKWSAPMRPDLFFFWPASIPYLDCLISYFHYIYGSLQFWTLFFSIFMGLKIPFNKHFTTMSK